MELETGVILIFIVKKNFSNNFLIKKDIFLYRNHGVWNLVFRVLTFTIGDYRKLYNHHVYCFAKEIIKYINNRKTKQCVKHIDDRKAKQSIGDINDGETL